MFAAVLAPFLENAVECAGFAFDVVAENAPLVDERRVDVLAYSILVSGRLDRLWHAQTFRLPCTAPLDSPGKNPRQLFPQLVGEILVLLSIRNDNVERNQPNPSPDGMVSAFDSWFMVRAKHQLVGRPELPEVLPHAPCADRFAARQLLDQRFR